MTDINQGGDTMPFAFADAEAARLAAYIAEHHPYDIPILEVLARNPMLGSDPALAIGGLQRIIDLNKS